MSIFTKEMGGRLIAALESGGTKMVAALASGPSDILVRTRIPTTSPEETMAGLIRFFSEATNVHGQPDALTVGTFGPADLDPDSESYGHITATPKAGWAQTDLLGPLRKALGGIPAVFETDVNAALFGEASSGAAKGLKHTAYFTVGTGIGGGLMIGGDLVHGSGHPEMGHMRVSRHPDDKFEGACSFHKDCLEGMACGPALEKRWGKSAEELPADHPAWEIEAHYLAQACLNVLMIAPPERIIFGGGVMHQEQLFPLIRKKLSELSNGYLPLPELDGFVVSPELGDDAGLLGCVALGRQLLRDQERIGQTKGS
ncbi:MAG: ROK family protein [Akkermansiaceae bacterium]|nr:ROK family protein [Akkermansiaceae bacterium]